MLIFDQLATAALCVFFFILRFLREIKIAVFTALQLLAIKQGHSCQANEAVMVSLDTQCTDPPFLFQKYASLMAPSLFLFTAFRHLFCSFMLCFVSPCFQLLCAIL